MILSTVLKSPKALMVGVSVVAILGAGWYVVSLKMDRDSLMEQKIYQQERISDLKSSVEGFKNQLDAQERTIEQYLKNTKDARHKQKRLETALSQASSGLQECLDRPLPPEILDELF